MIEAIFFDQDNTIVNTKAVTPKAYRKSIEYLALKMGVGGKNYGRSGMG